MIDIAARRSIVVSSRGFSLIELVVVIALIGAIAAFAWARLGTLFPIYQLEGAARALALELAKTRARAIAENRCFQVVFDTSAKTFQKQSKTGTASCGTTGFIADSKDGAARKIDSSGTLTVAATANPVFETRGSVSTTSAVTLTNTAGASRTVNVTSTGRVYVQ